MQKSWEIHRHKDVIIVEHAGQIYETLAVLDNKKYLIAFILFSNLETYSEFYFSLKGLRSQNL